MAVRLHRSLERPIREGLSWEELWHGPDQGLICCWEVGREERAEKPELAARASSGELVPLGWKRGTLKYLARWQGIRSEDLDLLLDSQRVIVCTKTGKSISFKHGMPPDGEGQSSFA